MRNQNPKEDDSDGTQHAKELQTTGDIMQRAETRKKYLHTVIKSTPNQFATLRYLLILVFDWFLLANCDI